MRNLFFDFRFAIRQLRKSPGFLSVAVLTLALGSSIHQAMVEIGRSGVWATALGCVLAERRRCWR